MGVLDDAIRDHLELKRRHGASDAELAQAEAEALGPARRDTAAAGFAETLEPAESAASEYPTDPGLTLADAPPAPDADVAEHHAEQPAADAGGYHPEPPDTPGYHAEPPEPDLGEQPPAVEPFEAQPAHDPLEPAAEHEGFADDDPALEEHDPLGYEHPYAHDEQERDYLADEPTQIHPAPQAYEEPAEDVVHEPPPDLPAEAPVDHPASEPAGHDEHPETSAADAPGEQTEYMPPPAGADEPPADVPEQPPTEPHVTVPPPESQLVEEPPVAEPPVEPPPVAEPPIEEPPVDPPQVSAQDDGPMRRGLDWLRERRSRRRRS